MRWLVIVIFTFSLPVVAKKMVTDAIVDIDFNHQFTPLNHKHRTKILIDRFHQTIYKTKNEDHGAHAMLDIAKRDGFSYRYTDVAITKNTLDTDILIIHGLPNLEVEVAENTTFWKSPISSSELEAIVRWVANGGGLFLTLSHFPGGSGARPLLEAFNVKFRDGYLYSKEFPSFTSPDERCSHFFGMSEGNKILKKSHGIFAMGETVNKVDFHCGAAVFREPDDVILAFPKGSANYDANDRLVEQSDHYAGMIGFQYGKGKVVVATDQGMFRNFIFTFDEKEKVYVTITSPNNDNANLFVNLLRWLSPKINDSRTLVE
ncbi:DUF4350 domain-containing protein [Aliikangiella coralliicola]|uniref:DUF4350 domain-containing protein n=1 Tax=Aliikangiella coralliicola TaxID=2592383 RepID=A0A545U8M3_9GAMM|nr:DUF4350 domain-containing protein [Aliikangiella coralliicola]TQV85819.1 hypothetical protein FLL46_18000 [Aliikangiella coralliicola]